MRGLKKFTCDFKDAVEAHLPLVSQGDKDDWNRRLKALMGIDEVDEEKTRRGCKSAFIIYWKNIPSHQPPQNLSSADSSTHFAAMFRWLPQKVSLVSSRPAGGSCSEVSSIARLRSDSSPQKLKAAAQQSFSGAAEQSLNWRRRGNVRKSRPQKDGRNASVWTSFGLKDEEDAEQAARRIVDSSSRIARMRLEDHQRQELSLRLQQAEEAPPSPPPPPAR